MLVWFWGVLNQVWSVSVGFVTLDQVCGASDREAGCQPAGPGRARRFLSIVVKSLRQGQLVGRRRVRRPDLFAATAGTATIRVRRVRLLTGSCLPRMTAQRVKLWAITAYGLEVFTRPVSRSRSVSFALPAGVGDERTVNPKCPALSPGQLWRSSWTPI